MLVSCCSVNRSRYADKPSCFSRIVFKIFCKGKLRCISAICMIFSGIWVCFGAILLWLYYCYFYYNKFQIRCSAQVLRDKIKLNDIRRHRVYPLKASRYTNVVNAASENPAAKRWVVFGRVRSWNKMHLTRFWFYWCKMWSRKLLPFSLGEPYA